MSDFLLSLLDLCLFPFSATDNLLIFVPTACITVIFLLTLIRLLMCGGR